MEYFKINYNKLQNLHQIKFYIVIIIIIVILMFLIVTACFMSTTKKISLYGYYNEGVLKVKINNKLSDILKNNKTLEFNNHKISYKELSYGEYEILENEIYQEVDIAIEKKFLNNEIGTVEIHYDKQKVIKYIFDLFK